MNKVSSKQLNYNSIIIALLFFYFSFTYLPYAYSSIVLMLVVLFFIIGVFLKKIRIKSSRAFIFTYLIITIPFILTVISVLISKNMEAGLYYIQLRISILIIPFIILNILENKQQLKNSIPIFILLSLFALFSTVYRLIEQDPYTFYMLSTECSSQITIIQHPYFGILQLVAIVFTLEFLRHTQKFIYYLLLLLFTIGVLISTSRICYVLYVLIVIYYLSKFITRKKAIIIFLIMGSVVTTLIATNSELQRKFTRSFVFETSPRLRLWNNSYLVLKNSEHPVIGMGIGDFYAKKEDTYWLRGTIIKLNEQNLYHGLLGYNPHSQYVEFILLNGVLGLLFIAMIGYCLVICFRKNDFFTMSLILIIALFSFSESLLNRQYGVVLYSFLMPIILGLTLYNKQEKITEH